jgi:hypothetical protein
MSQDNSSMVSKNLLNYGSHLTPNNRL